jgi:hypothetical protein
MIVIMNDQVGEMERSESYEIWGSHCSDYVDNCLLDVKPYSVVDGYWHFGSFYLQGRGTRR